MNVVIGTPICRNSAYVIDRFLSNQQEIQRCCPSSELVLATSEHDFIEDLQRLVDSAELRATLIPYSVSRPSHARSNLWDIACGREAIRRHILSRPDVGYVLFLDADMTFEPTLVEKLEREIQAHDAVFSGYPLRQYGTGLAGAGCLMITRSILEKIEFRCCEFKSGEVIFEDNMLELDLFRLRARVKKGFFVSITHYPNADESRSITPQPVGLGRRLVNAGPVRYALIRTSISVRRNIPWRLKMLLSRVTSRS